MIKGFKHMKMATIITLSVAVISLLSFRACTL